MILCDQQCDKNDQLLWLEKDYMHDGMRLKTKTQNSPQVVTPNRFERHMIYAEKKMLQNVIPSSIFYDFMHTYYINQIISFHVTFIRMKRGQKEGNKDERGDTFGVEQKAEKGQEIRSKTEPTIPVIEPNIPTSRIPTLAPPLPRARTPS